MSLEDRISQLIATIEKLNSNIEKLGAINNADVSSDRLIPLCKWNDVHEWPSIAALRSIVFNEKYNGAKHFIRRIGRRVYIDEKKYFEWADSHPKTHIVKN